MNEKEQRRLAVSICCVCNKLIAIHVLSSLDKSVYINLSHHSWISIFHIILLKITSKCFWKLNYKVIHSALVTYRKQPLLRFCLTIQTYWTYKSVLGATYSPPSFPETRRSQTHNIFMYILQVQVYCHLLHLVQTTEHLGGSRSPILVNSKH